jgi:hypothetical protein
LSRINLDGQAHFEEAAKEQAAFAVTNTRLLRLARSAARCWMIRAVPHGLFLFSDGISGVVMSMNQLEGINDAESLLITESVSLLDRLRGT